MRHLLTTASLAALIASFGIAGAQSPPAQPERPAAQQQQQRQQGEERQRQPGQAQQEQRQPGQAQQQQRGEDRERQPGQAQQRGEERQPSQAQEPRQQQRQPGQAQEPTQQQRQPSQAQEPRQQQRQPGQAQEPTQQQRQPSQAQEPRQQQRQPGQAQDQQQQRQQPSTAQPQQQPGAAQQPAQAQQQPAGSGEVSSRIASNPEIQTRVQQSVTNIRPVNVNVDVRVGASIPRTVELQPVPQAIIEIAPRYREYRVIRVREEIVIINPRSYEVVEVIRVGGGRVGAAPSGTRAQIQLTAQQRQLVLRHAREARSARTTTQIRVTEGQPLTERVELEAIPQEIITEVPTLREYRYFVTGDQVVIVDPSTNVVAEVIR